MLTLLLWLLILCVVIWAANALLTAFGIGDPIRTVIFVVIVLLVVFALIQALGGSGDIRIPRFNLS